MLQTFPNDARQIPIERPFTKSISVDSHFQRDARRHLEIRDVAATARAMQTNFHAHLGHLKTSNIVQYTVHSLLVC